MNNYSLEVCVDSVESAINAQKGGATRLELCQNLIIGGTSPSIELFKIVRKNVNIPINVLIRPRFGDFCYSDYELDVILNEISLFKNNGADGVVIGALDYDGDLAVGKIEKMISLAGTIHKTLHRAFDMAKDPFKTLEFAHNLGFNSVLTSGRKNTAIEGLNLLDLLSESAVGLEIMVGGGVNMEVVKEFVAKTHIRSFHMSGKKKVDSPMLFRNSDVNMGVPGFSEYDNFVTDADKILEVSEYLKAL